MEFHYLLTDIIVSNFGETDILTNLKLPIQWAIFFPF